MLASKNVTLFICALAPGSDSSNIGILVLVFVQREMRSNVRIFVGRKMRLFWASTGILFWASKCMIMGMIRANSLEHILL